jgi:hypothetical protein
VDTAVSQSVLHVMVVDAPRQSPSLPIADHDAFRGQLLPDLGT